MTKIVAHRGASYLAGRDNSERIFIGVIAIVIIAVMLVISICIFKSKKIKSPIKLETDMQGKNLFIEEKDMEYLLGKKGVACTDLRPSGKGEFNGVKLDILSDGEFIKKGVKITVTEIKNNKIFVREDK